MQRKERQLFMEASEMVRFLQLHVIQLTEASVYIQPRRAEAFPSASLDGGVHRFVEDKKIDCTAHADAVLEPILGESARQQRLGPYRAEVGG